LEVGVPELKPISEVVKPTVLVSPLTGIRVLSAYLSKNEMQHP
jgi:hypothetical protein